MGARSSLVKTVASHIDGIVSPVTVGGRLLAASAEGVPLVAACHPEWIASTLAETPNWAPLRYSLTALLSHLFPEQFQTYWDVAIEPTFVPGSLSLGALMGAKSALPSSLLLPALFAVDAANSLAFISFLLFDVRLVAAACAMVIAGRMRCLKSSK